MICTVKPSNKCNCVLFIFTYFVFSSVVIYAQASVKKPVTNIDADWPVYASSNQSTKYAALNQVNTSNFKQLKIAWQWTSVDQPLLDADTTLHTWKNESTPLKIGNVLYTTTSLSQVAAIDAATGNTIWQYNSGTYKNGSPPNMGFVNRGLAYWENGNDKRVYIATGDAFLIAVDCTTGTPVQSFGNGGKIDLTRGLRREIDRQFYGVSSPALICNNVVVVGSTILDYPAADAMPPGDVRGFDATTGRLLWTFESVPQREDFGSATWENDSWKTMGNTNVWAWMSCDEKLGCVYLPFGTPANDFYGGRRKGNNLFGESIVALDIKTGKRIWHFQTVHHGLWDYDLPAPPCLADVTINHQKRKILAQVTKQGFVFVLDRTNGKPIWPIAERAVAASDVPGESASATQPFPTNPLPFERQGIDTADLINFTPELRQLALTTLEKYDYGPLFTPPTEKGLVIRPGIFGGASWSGAAVDPAKGILYTPSVTKPAVIHLFTLPNQRDGSAYAGYWALDEFIGPGGLPLVKPPYGKITAIKLSTGKQVWVQPVGNSLNNHPLLKNLGLKNIGSPERNHVLLTKTLLLAAQEAPTTYGPSPFQNGVMAFNKTQYPCLRAFHPQSGKLIGEVALPANASGAPITYTVNRKQFIVIPFGGASEKAGLIALALPD